MKTHCVFVLAMVVSSIVTTWACESAFAGDVVSFGTDDYTIQHVRSSCDFVDIADYHRRILALESDGPGTAGFYYALYDDEIVGEFWHVIWNSLEDGSTLIVCEGYLENIADYELKDVGLTIQFWHFWGRWSPPVFFDYDNSDHTWYRKKSWARTYGVLGQDKLLSLKRSKTDVPLSVTLKGVTAYSAETDEVTLISFGDLSPGERAYKTIYAVSSSQGYGWRGYVVSTSPHGPVNLVGLEIMGPNEVAENSSTRYTAIASYDNGSKTDVSASATWSLEPNSIASIEAGLLRTGKIDEPQDITIYARHVEGGVTLETQMAVEVYPHTPCMLYVPLDYGSIQAAIDAAVDGDTVIVAPGTYSGDGNRDIKFGGKAITVCSTNPNDPNVIAATIIDCNGTKDEPHRGFYFRSGEDANSVLDGLTITNGYADQGGGVYCVSSNPTITNCTFRDNSAYFNGGGMHNSNNSNPVVTNCRFTDNRSSSIGGGIYCSSDSTPMMINCTITDNWASYGGGGIYCFENGNPTLTSCIIRGNLAKGFGDMYGNVLGGGICCVGSSPTITNCIINGNSAQGEWPYGGGIYCNNGSSPKVTKCTISGNRATDGGGIYCVDSSPKINNCVIRANVAKSIGGAMYCYHDSEPTISNCIILGNSAKGKGGGIYCYSRGGPTVTNCILWGDTAADGAEIALRSSDYPSSLTISHSDVQGGLAAAHVDSGCTLNWDLGNIDADPCFAFSDDYHLIVDSPCIDAGTNDPLGGLSTEDLDGNARSLDGDGDGYAVADMGVYEFNVEEPSIAVSTTNIEIFVPESQTDVNDQTVGVRNCGGGKLKWELMENCGWLEIFPTAGRSLGEIDEVIFRGNAVGLEHGDYACRVEVVDEQAVNSSRWLTVTLHVNTTLGVPEQYETIQAAIDEAVDGDVVLVADGTYSGDGNRDIDFSGKAITVRSENGAESCIIDCEGTENEPHRGFFFSNKKNVKSFLSGFTITGGDGYDKGGAIFCSNASPTITNCIITGNAAGGKYAYGGGMYCEEFSSMRISSCTLSDNLVYQIGDDYYSDLYGGGIYSDGGNLTLTNCTFGGNRLEGRHTSGGGLYCENANGLTINNCTVTGNTPGGIYFISSVNAKISNCTVMGNSGVGVCCSSNINAKISNCTISSNTGYSGGGIYCSSNDNTTISNCTITDNLADYGGGIYCFKDISTISNCTIAGNSADDYGGGILCRGDIEYYFECRPTIKNCTIIANTAGRHGGAITCYNNTRPTIINSILWGNNAPNGPEISLMKTMYPPSPHLTISYSTVQGGVQAANVEKGSLNWGPGNIDANPLFTDPVRGDYHLLPSSPCINAGDPGFIPQPNGTDIDGQPRVMGGRVDMGADEVLIATMKFTPQALNPNSKGKWLKAHFVLPEGFGVDDVDTNSPAKIEPLGIESEYINVFVNEDGLVEIEAAFGRAAFCGAATDYRPVEVTVIGLFTSGQYFYGTDTIKIINKTFEYLGVLASHWLEAGCGAPDWCGGVDLDHSSMVDFVDFAMFDGCCIEVIRQ